MIQGSGTITNFQRATAAPVHRSVTFRISSDVGESPVSGAPRVRVLLHSQAGVRDTGLSLSQRYGFVEQSNGHVKLGRGRPSRLGRLFSVTSPVGRGARTVPRWRSSKNLVAKRRSDGQLTLSIITLLIEPIFFSSA